jgi:leucyl-tRNA synthetase
LAETEVNWCPALGTVLANDEIVNGVSERGGHPVIRKKMTQWSMRISAYAERLLQGLNDIDWSESIKESQRNWIGKSVGAMVKFQVPSSEFKVDGDNSQPETRNSQLFIEVFTTRPDTIFGVTFMTLAPEHELVSQITTPEQRTAVDAYVEATAKRSERERMADVKTISGVFTGAFAEHPFTKEPITFWPVTEQEQLWRFHVATNVIMLSQIFSKVRMECPKLKIFSTKIFRRKHLVQKKVSN